MRSSSGPVFGKLPNKARASFSVPAIISHTEPHSNDPDGEKIQKITKSGLKSEEKLRLIQLEISEKEACNVLRTICHDAAKMFNMTGNEAEIRDLLTGILILGNLCKRIGHEKIAVEQKLEEYLKTQGDMETKYKDTIDQLEQVILKLQAENIKSSDNLTEATYKHNLKTTMMNKEMKNLQDKLDDLKIENERLNTKLQYSERKIMDIPRLEEQYMRNARTVVRQQEVANTMNKIEMKKAEEEVKTMNFWKHKAKSLEEIVKKLEQENADLVNYQRKQHSQFTTLLSSHDRLKGKQVPSTPEMGQKVPKGDGKRPSSAPATRSAPAQPSLFTMNSIEEGGGLTTTEPSNAFDDAKLTSSGVATSSSADVHHKKRSQNKKQDEIARAVKHMNADEIKRLYQENATKQQQILRLSQKLSFARAYPLRSIDDAEEWEGGMTMTQGNHDHTTSNGELHHQASMTFSERLNASNQKPPRHQQHHQHSPHHKGDNNNALYKDEIFAMRFMQDELESISSGFLAQEKVLADARMDRAVDLQMQYNTRRNLSSSPMKQKRGSDSNVPNTENPNYDSVAHAPVTITRASSHIQHIRQSKSFSNILTTDEWDNEERNVKRQQDNYQRERLRFGLKTSSQSPSPPKSKS